MNGHDLELKAAVINNPKRESYGKPCIIDTYIPEEDKYLVTFNAGWCGWYKREELKVDGVDK